MNGKTTFTILNQTGQPLNIIHEPEVVEWNLPKDEEVKIETGSCADAILLRVYLEDGKVSIDILDSKSLYKVMHKGKDVFEEYL